ncbi:MAL5 [Cyberlindnera jadinii]|uniref:MAL5 protein n=1 Tax=Cyberlindnera jadinii (strain ATCC 18201 / CBS 1600 / BCRC 20928 / JCM 3617 / NBRC 0987 / NRRL Y-1542) TaxID=983966 RepID=A0A0H5C0H2_CYBJN|nr:MAL5 [Cyberlindnera jadinii]
MDSDYDKKCSDAEHIENVSRFSSNDTKLTDTNGRGIIDIEPTIYELDESQINQDAQEANEEEHELSVREAISLYKASIFWAAVMSATIIMEGYDNILMSSFFAYPSFKDKFGQPVDGNPNDKELTGPWQVGLSCAAASGAVVGVLANGYLTERWGHRRVILANLTLMAAFIFIPFFAQTIQHLLVGQILCGLVWGVFATMGPSYSSEIMPLALRGYLAAYVNLCWATGQFVAAGVLQAFVSNTTEWSYRVPFAIQWVWIPPLFILTILCPDSPAWLIRKGRIDDAIKATKRLSHKSIHEKAHQRVSMMIRTNELEKEQEMNNIKGWKSYVECFKGFNRRRTEIACVAFAGQVLSGSTFAYSPSYFFSQAGLNSSDTYKLNLGTTGIAWTGTVLSWFLLRRYGRRTIYVTGFAILTAVLLLIGILACPPQTSAIKWAQCGVVIAWVATYAMTIGPLAFTIVGEMSATRLRAQSIALARGSYSIVSLISNVVEPYLINPSEANLKGKTAFVWLGTATCVLVWSFFRLPETRDRSFAELDIMFEKGIPARQFSNYQFDWEDEIKNTSKNQASE